MCCLQEVKGGLASVAALGGDLPALVATLHGNLRQIVTDLDTLTKTHPACADVAPLCRQVWLLEPRFRCFFGLSRAAMCTAILSFYALR